MEQQERTPAYQEVGSGYRDQWELMQDEMAVLDYRLYLFYQYHQWVGPKSEMKNMLGFVVTREEFEHNLLKAAQTGLEDKLQPEEAEQLALDLDTIRLRLKKTERGRFPLLLLFDRFRLGAFEQGCILLAYASVLDDKYEKLFAYLQDDITKKRPTISLAVSLLMERGQHAERYRSLLASAPSFQLLFEPDAWKEGALALTQEVLAFLNGETRLPQGYTLWSADPAAPDPGLPVRSGLGRQLDALFAVPSCAGVLSGRPGSGRRHQVQQLCRRHGERCLFADLSVCGREPEAVRKGAMLARMTGSLLCVIGPDSVSPEGEWQPPSPELADALAHADLSRGRLFVLSERPLHLHLSIPMLEFELPELDAAERLTLFRHCFAQVPLGADVSLPELASKFHFTPGQIVQAAQQAAGQARIAEQPLDAAELHRCCYRQVVHKLDTLAKRIQPGYQWEDLVLPEAQKRLLRQACAHIRWQQRVFGEWGFGRKIRYGTGLSVLFDGVPGTGKTLCAQIMARELNMEMYKINLSQIVSKYIGETEKNLQAVFREARNSNCILFFDECDALFGKRSEVKDSHDRNANVETAYLLQQIEEFDGVCILATNLLQNIDEAFLRRITFVVHFPFPDAGMREAIYRATLPPEAPVEEDVDWRFLAEKFELSGGYIKNIVLAASFMAAQEGSRIGMRHFLNAAVNELKKNEIVVVRESLQEYADLLDP